MVDNQNTTPGNSWKCPQQIGPVTAAIRAVQETPEHSEIRALREAVEARIEADIRLLDQLDAGEFRR